MSCSIEAISELYEPFKLKLNKLRFDLFEVITRHTKNPPSIYNLCTGSICLFFSYVLPSILITILLCFYFATYILDILVLHFISTCMDRVRWPILFLKKFSILEKCLTNFNASLEPFTDFPCNVIPLCISNERM